MADYEPDKRSLVVEVTEAGIVVELNPKRAYTITHLGKTAAGADTTATVFGQANPLGSDDDVQTTYETRYNKVISNPGLPMPVPISTTDFRLRTAASTGSAVVSINPSEILPMQPLR